MQLRGLFFIRVASPLTHTQHNVTPPTPPPPPPAQRFTAHDFAVAKFVGSKKGAADTVLPGDEKPDAAKKPAAAGAGAEKKEGDAKAAAPAAAAKK